MHSCRLVCFSNFMCMFIFIFVFYMRMFVLVVFVYKALMMCHMYLNTQSRCNHCRYYGASTVGTLVVFAPYNAPEVGVYDASTKEFSTTAATGMTAGPYRYHVLLCGMCRVYVRVLIL